MKFFTLDWWSSACEDADELFRKYQLFVADFFDRLPESYQRLHRDWSLHDSRLRVFKADYQHQTLDLHLDGHGFDEKDNTYFERRFTLRYYDVRQITATSDPDRGLPGPNGYGDLGYDEIELLSSGDLEHRILFSSGIVLLVRHGGIKIDVSDNRK
ncbi:hypothetical protein [Roseibacillus persicicus]|uniref:hypothetical protein n=1 Tax=Roseibacillus persicicus TaxID=454148 RepID=UPI00167AC87D|nr:hypothetical protein [Roseibacillus persicicus]